MEWFTSDEPTGQSNLVLFSPKLHRLFVTGWAVFLIKWRTNGHDTSLNYMCNDNNVHPYTCGA